MPWRRETEVVGSHPECLADTRAGVVEEEQERVVPQPGGATAVGLIEEHSHVLGLEVLDEPLASALGTDRENAAVLLGARKVVAKEMLDEASDCGESAITGRGLISPNHLDVIEEGKHSLDDDVVETEATDGAATDAGRDHEPGEIGPAPTLREQEGEKRPQRRARRTRAPSASRPASGSGSGSSRGTAERPPRLAIRQALPSECSSTRNR